MSRQAKWSRRKTLQDVSNGEKYISKIDKEFYKTIKMMTNSIKQQATTKTHKSQKIKEQPLDIRRYYRAKQTQTTLRYDFTPIEWLAIF